MKQGGYYRFEQLDVWKLARDFTNIIYVISRDFPADERYGLTSQIRRSAVSIMLNIAEGSERKSDKEYIRFLRIAYTSLLETMSSCYTAKDQNYMSEGRFTYIYNKSHILSKKINALIKYLAKED